ncbi:hypothetical protein GGR56DRAFT_677161 [Xylariaceae sp. FL0804]|nr:hypothetical protein GGR56DRAFT_677161 [Xylariaceae sp. FL0804]
MRRRAAAAVATRAASRPGPRPWSLPHLPVAQSSSRGAWPAAAAGHGAASGSGSGSAAAALSPSPSSRGTCRRPTATRSFATLRQEGEDERDEDKKKEEQKKEKQTSVPLRVLFCGSDEFSCMSLAALAAEHARNPGLVASIDVVARPGKRTGRGLKAVRHPPIRDLATKLGLPIHERDTFTGWEMPEHINLIVAVSFGLFVPPRLLSRALYGGLNLHPSLLPDLRGPAPLQHALLRGRALAGVSLQTLHPRSFDRGVVLAQTSAVADAPGALRLDCVDRDHDQGYDDKGVKSPLPLRTPAQIVRHVVGPAAARMLVAALRDGLHVPPLRPAGWDAQPPPRLLLSGQDEKKQKRYEYEFSDPDSDAAAAVVGLAHAPKITKADAQLTNFLDGRCPVTGTTVAVVGSSSSSSSSSSSPSTPLSEEDDDKIDATALETAAFLARRQHAIGPLWFWASVTVTEGGGGGSDGGGSSGGERRRRLRVIVEDLDVVADDDDHVGRRRRLLLQCRPPRLWEQQQQQHLRLDDHHHLPPPYRLFPVEHEHEHDAAALPSDPSGGGGREGEGKGEGQAGRRTTDDVVAAAAPPKRRRSWIMFWAPCRDDVSAQGQGIRGGGGGGGGGGGRSGGPGGKGERGRLSSKGESESEEKRKGKGTEEEMVEDDGAVYLGACRIGRLKIEGEPARPALQVVQRLGLLAAKLDSRLCSAELYTYHSSRDGLRLELRAVKAITSATITTTITTQGQ